MEIPTKFKEGDKLYYIENNECIRYLEVMGLDISSYTMKKGDLKTIVYYVKYRMGPMAYYVHEKCLYKTVDELVESLKNNIKED